MEKSYWDFVEHDYEEALRPLKRNKPIASQVKDLTNCNYDA